EWKKQEGEQVAAGDVLAEVETDKAVMELVARVSGVLLRQTVKAGQTVPVSTPVAVIGAPGGAVAARDRGAADPGKRRAPQPAQHTAAKPAAQKPAAAPPASAAPAPPPPSAAQPSSAATASFSAPGARVKASPLARRIAAERGLDLRGVRGSG